jgi:hypothetical protein
MEFVGGTLRSPSDEEPTTLRDLKLVYLSHHMVSCVS